MSAEMLLADAAELAEELDLQITPAGYALVAVTSLLDAAASDPDLRRVLRASGDLFGELCVIEASLLGRPAADVLADRSAQIPQGPRRYMTAAEWYRMKALEIAHEGEIGSHWPDKERHHASER